MNSGQFYPSETLGSLINNYEDDTEYDEWLASKKWIYILQAKLSSRICSVCQWL